MKNYIGQTLGLTALLTAMLLILSAVSKKTTLGGIPLRKMDILADIRKNGASNADDSATPIESDTAGMNIPVDTSFINRVSVANDTSGLPPFVDSVYFGQVIEDYSPDQSGLQAFFMAVDSIAIKKRSVRVAFFGDSFVEGDIVLGDLRDTLQTLWGGEGVGFAPITSEVARFKRTLIHDYSGWSAFSIVKNHNSGQPFGINGYAYRPQAGARVRYQGTTQYGFRHTAGWSRVRLFYTADQADMVEWTYGDGALQSESLPAKSGAIGLWQWRAPREQVSDFSMRFQNTEGLIVYGASLEGGPGFYLDNFSVRGNTGGRLRHIRSEIVRQFDAWQQYDLIVLQLGLNAVGNNTRNITWYRHELDATYAHIRACFPGRPILVVGVPDRADKVNDELVTMAGVPAITRMQRELARKHGFLFYDLFRGMGGPGAIVSLAHQRPALANKDYTHLTHEGGKVIGRLFARIFLEEQARYRAEAAKNLN